MCPLLTANWESGIHEINSSSEMGPKPSQDVRQMLNFKQTNIPATCGWFTVFWVNTDFLNPKLSFAFHAWNKLATHDATGRVVMSIIRLKEKILVSLKEQQRSRLHLTTEIQMLEYLEIDPKIT